MHRPPTLLRRPLRPHHVDCDSPPDQDDPPFRSLSAHRPYYAPARPADGVVPDALNTRRAPRHPSRHRTSSLAETHIKTIHAAVWQRTEGVACRTEAVRFPRGYNRCTPALAATRKKALPGETPRTATTTAPPEASFGRVRPASRHQATRRPDQIAKASSTRGACNSTHAADHLAGRAPSRPCPLER